MTYERFAQLWSALVTDRAPTSSAACPLPHSNGVSQHTVDALIEVADGNHAQFDDIQAKLETIAEQETAAA